MRSEGMGGRMIHQGDLFILGAGFSKAISTLMPSMHELGEAVYATTPNKAEPPEEFKDDLELQLTYLSQRHPWMSEVTYLRNRALFLDLCDAIRLAIQGPACSVGNKWPDWLTALIRYWVAKRSSVITFNYDCLIESAALALGIVVDYPVPLVPSERRGDRDFFSPVIVSDPTFSLLKLHGSVNWFYTGSDAFIGEPIYRTEPGLGEPVPEDVRTDLVGLVPLIVPPITDKLTYCQPNIVRAIWTEAEFAIKTTPRIFCLGYSLPHTDLTVRYLLSSTAHKKGKTDFFVVNTDPRAPEHFRKLVPGTCAIEGEFARSGNPIADFVAWLCPACRQK